MNIFTKRNALVGFIVLRVLGRSRANRRYLRALKISAFVALALVSMGILAALLAVALRRQRENGQIVAGESEDQLDESSVDDDFGAGLPEPGFAA